MASNHYLNFLGTAWDMLSDEDKNFFGEAWQAYEQIFASVYQQFSENNLNIALQDLQPYSTERWLKYQFNGSSKILRAATYTSSQDMSVGLNLSNKYLLKIAVNGGAPFEVDVRGLNPLVTTIDEVVTKINKAAGFPLARTVFENTIIQLVSNVIGPTSSLSVMATSIPSKNASEFVLGVQQEDLPALFPKYPHVYKLEYDKVVDIPALRNAIRDESLNTVYSSGTDYAIEKGGLITFKSEPIPVLWAKRTLFDTETPWGNFGYLMGIYQPNTPSYLSVIQGLWFAFWMGPRPSNLLSALYLLFGLPVAAEAATVTNITSEFIETTSQSGVVRIFTIPSELTAIVTLGQSVSRFQPLVSGIDIYDKVNYPGFISEEVGRAGVQRFLLDEATRGSGDTDETKALRMLEEHTFLPQISVNAFTSPDINLGNVKSFLNDIKPLNKAFLFQVIVGTFKDALDMKEGLGIDVSLDITPNLDSNQTTFISASDLATYETTDNSALNLDSDGVLFQEQLDGSIYSFGTLVSTFVA